MRNPTHIQINNDITGERFSGSVSGAGVLSSSEPSATPNLKTLLDYLERKDLPEETSTFIKQQIDKITNGTPDPNLKIYLQHIAENPNHPEKWPGISIANKSVGKHFSQGESVQKLIEDVREKLIVERYLNLFPKIPINDFFRENEYLKIHLDGKSANCRRINLSERNLSESDFSDAWFEEANLKKAILKNVNLNGTKLDRADISEVKKLKSKKLAMANFTNLVVDNQNRKIVKKAMNIKRIQYIKEEKEILDKLEAVRNVFIKYVNIEDFLGKSSTLEKKKFLQLLSDDKVRVYFEKNITYTRYKP